MTSPAAVTRPGHAQPTAPIGLIDPLCGIVQRVVTAKLPDGAPAGYLSKIAVVADTRRFARDWLCDRLGGGTSWGEESTARLAAVGEAVERYCGNLIPDDLPVSSIQELRSGGRLALGPEHLPRFSARQLSRPRFRYQSWDETTRLRWVVGTRDDGAPVHVPGAHVYLNWHSGARGTDPRIVHLQYSGIATGSGIADAAGRALAEVIERDAFVGWWTLDLPGVGIDISSVPGLSEAFADSPLELSLQALPSEFGLPVVVAAVFDPRRRLYAVGVSAQLDPGAAATKATAEAVQVWTSACGLLQPDGMAFRAVEQGIFSSKVFLPYRADRRYGQDAGENLEHIRDLAAHVQLWLDPDIIEKFGNRLRPKGSAQINDAAQRAVRWATTATSVTGTRLPTEPVAGLAELRHRLALTGRHPVTVDLTTSDVAATGWAVARVLVPSLLTNAPAAFAYLGTPRLAELADRYGRGGHPPTLVPPPHN